MNYEAKNSSVYKQHELFRSTLSSLVKRQIEVSQLLNMSIWEKNLHQLHERVLADNFKVLVIGEFRRGKSTFINAMLGQEVLPAYAIPTTAIINEVKWGDTPHAVLHYTKSSDGSESPPIEIPVDQIEQYVVIQDGKTHRDAIVESPYEKVELFWNLDLCRNGVEIIDSPGLNENEVRQKVTTNYLSSVDAIVFVLSSLALFSDSEQKVIDNMLKPSGHEDIFFVCNFFNMLRKPKDREDIMQRGKAFLEPRTNLGTRGVFYINALGALDGRMEGDTDQVRESGMLKLEQELNHFLAHERGRIKILRPAKELKQAIYEAQRIIPEREALLRTDLKTIEERYQAAQEPLHLLEVERQQIVMRMSNFRSDMQQIIFGKARSFYRNLCETKIDKYDNKISQWVQQYKLQSPIKTFSPDVLPWQIKAAVERVSQEIIEHLANQLESECASWQKTELHPLVTKRLEDLTLELDARARVFISRIDDLRIQMSGISAKDLSVQLASVSPLERILGIAGGLLLQDVVTAGIGGVFGVKEMLINIVQQITLAIVTVALVGFNPWILIPVMMSGGLLHGLIKLNTTNDEIKKAVAKKYVEQLRQSSTDRASEIASIVDKKLLQLQDAVDQGLAKEIQGIREQVDSIVEEKKKGQENVDEKLRELELLSKELNEINNELHTLTIQVGGG
jgi:GTPase SAR1 family protein